MKQLIKYAAMCLVIGSVSGTAQAKSAPLGAAPQSNCMTACAVTAVKSSRRVVRVETAPTKKLHASQAYNGKYLAKLNTRDQAYGKVLVPVKPNTRTPNYFRPLN